MYGSYPIYYPSAQYARENGEIDLWRESFNINRECRDFINGKASHAYHDRTLPDFMKELTDIFGLERAMFVTARFVVAADWDGRYGRDVKERAAQVDFQDMKEAQKRHETGQEVKSTTADRTTDLYSNVHPCILNDIFRSLMKMEQEQIVLLDDSSTPENEFSEGAEL